MGEKVEIFEFAEFRFVPSENSLERAGEPISLPPRAHRVLELLVKNSGHVVSKDTVLSEVWNDVAVEEATVARTVWLIRQALGDNPHAHEFIQTIPKLGYRFVGDVRNIETGDASSSTTNGHHAITGQAQVSNGEVVGQGPVQTKLAVPIAFAAAMIVVIATVGFYYLAPRSSAYNGTPSIAILPFRPLNTAGRDEMLEVGFADSLIHRLAPNRAIEVRPLSATRKYVEEADLDPVAAGRQQKVGYVLASNYQFADGKFRVTAQLFDIATGQIEMSHKFETPAAAVLDVQDAVAEELGNRLIARFAPEASRTASGRGTNNEEAYRYYLLAQNFNEMRGPENSRRALEQIDRAVDLDPNFARAWATKAYIHRYSGYGAAAIDHSVRSIEAVDKALSLDPDLSEAHSVRCFNKFRYEYDFAGAEAACKRAIELDPNSPLAHKLYGNFLYTRGRFDEALAEIQKAIDLQPLSYDNQQTYGLALFFAGRYADAEEQWKELLPLNPNHRFIYGQLVKCLVLQQKEAEAFDYLVKMLELEQAGNETIERFKTAFANAGWRGVTLERIKLDRLREDRANALARYYAAVGDNDKAFEYLERSLSERSNMIAVVEIDPELEPLRNDPRYIEFLRKIDRSRAG